MHVFDKDAGGTPASPTMPAASNGHHISAAKSHGKMRRVAGPPRSGKMGRVQSTYDGKPALLLCRRQEEGRQDWRWHRRCLAYRQRITNFCPNAGSFGRPLGGACTGRRTPPKASPSTGFMSTTSRTSGTCSRMNCFPRRAALSTLLALNFCVERQVRASSLSRECHELVIKRCGGPRRSLSGQRMRERFM